MMTVAEDHSDERLGW